MSDERAVEAALDRWEDAGLLSPELASSLRREAQEYAARSSGRTARYALAATGAAVLLVAAGVLADWLWPLLEARTRTLIVGLVGLAVHGLGILLGGRARWRAASVFLQVAGLLVLLGTYMYSEAAWDDGSPGGILVGLLALATPLATAPRSLLSRDPFMPAFHLSLLLGFLAVFLDRATPLSADAILWVLDGVLVVLGMLLLRALARDPEGSDWALNAFVMAMYAGLLLVALTGLEVFRLDESTLYGVDAWLLGMTALTLWGIHRAPPALQRDWFERQLGGTVLLWIPFLFATCIELWDAPAELTALLVGGVGAAGLWHSVRFGGRQTLVASCLAVLAAAWYYGIERGGALGVVLSLGLSAAFLFWVSTRIGWDREPPAGGSGDVDARAPIF
jgi:hypothetical protein